MKNSNQKNKRPNIKGKKKLIGLVLNLKGANVESKNERKNKNKKKW